MRSARRTAWPGVFGALGALLVFVAPALAQEERGRRLALVVGNDAYVGQPVLQNAVNDARAVASALEDVGFAVTTVEDATRASLVEALDTFAGSLRSTDVALFYFAGHGVQVDQANYLIPTDYTGTSATSLRLNALSAAFVEEELRRARVAMLVFDACRNNPYRGFRTSGGGLAPMEPRGTLIAYAAGSGQVAADAAPGAANGLFTAKFVEALQAPGLGASELFRRVRREVYAASMEQQFPAVYDGLLADFVFRPAGVSAAAAQAALNLDRNVRRRIQRALAAAGFDPGPPDGVFGAATRASIRAWQTARGSAPTGYLDAASVAVLQPVGATPPGTDRESERTRLAAFLGRDLSASEWDENGWTDLHYAAVLDLPDVVRELLANGTSVDAKLYVDGEPISDRILGTLPEISSRATLYISRRHGQTPLQLAALFDARRAVAALLQSGANIQATNVWGATPLHHAAVADAAEAAIELIGRGADIHSSHDDGSPLHAAASGNAREIIELLLDRGANLHATNGSGATALHEAAYSNSREVAELLLDRGLSLHSTSGSGRTALHYAAMGGALEVAELLIDRGASVQATDSEDYTPLHFAAIIDDNGLEVAELLLDHGANVDVTTGYGDTPLHGAAVLSRLEVMRLLLDRGATVDATEVSNRETPLLEAVRRGADAEVVELLLDRGAHIEAKTNRGYTPLHYAAYWNHRELADRLLASGADVNATAEGRTPLAMVGLQLQNGGADDENGAMRALLLQYGAR